MALDKYKTKRAERRRRAENKALSSNLSTMQMPSMGSSKRLNQSSLSNKTGRTQSPTSNRVTVGSFLNDFTEEKDSDDLEQRQQDTFAKLVLMEEAMKELKEEIIKVKDAVATIDGKISGDI